MSLGPSARAMCSVILSRVLVGARHMSVKSVILSRWALAENVENLEHVFECACLIRSCLEEVKVYTCSVSDAHTTLGVCAARIFIP